MGRRDDALGHWTRGSDSSIYDEVCVYCGATDARTDKRLESACRASEEDRQKLPYGFDYHREELVK